jgi:CTP synthase
VVHNTKYIFVTGGVVSSLGKGLAAASLAALLKARGYKVHLRKFEPYINVDPGTMNPSQHGEVFVTDDGAETDLDLGHYERFTGVSSRASDAISTGRIYSTVIARERRGDYLGATVQVIPHITDCIKEHITKDVDEDTDFMLIEVGGTIGDIEGIPFVEAIRQFVNDVGRENALLMHLTLIPFIPSADELKTKPSQHSVKEMLRMGLQPDMLLCRCDRPIPLESRRKLALFCNIKPDNVIEALDVPTIYKVPQEFHEHGLDNRVLDYFKIKDAKEPDLSMWHNIVKRVMEPKHETTIAVVGKYMDLKDAYKSLYEAIIHGGIAHSAKVNVKWIDAEELEDCQQGVCKPISQSVVAKKIGKVHGILIPGGYGSRGIEGKIAAITYARENNIPFLGICLGMQLATIETARNVAGIADANSTEFGPTTEPIVGLLTEWVKLTGKIERRSEESELGGTMRLGAYDCHVKSGTLAYKIYDKKSVISERHRHRYEVNIKYKDALEKAGMIISGMSANGQLPTMSERPDHPWFLCMQFHPELKSRPFDPSPVFVGFVGAALKHEKQ